MKKKRYSSKLIRNDGENIKRDEFKEELAGPIVENELKKMEFGDRNIINERWIQQNEKKYFTKNVKAKTTVWYENILDYKNFVFQELESFKEQNSRR